MLNFKPYGMEVKKHINESPHYPFNIITEEDSITRGDYIVTYETENCYDDIKYFINNKVLISYIYV